MDSLIFVLILPYKFCNQDKSAASFCRHMAEWVPNMFCIFYLTKNHKFANNSTTTKLERNNKIQNPQKFMYIWLNFITVRFCIKKQPLISSDKQAIYKMEHPNLQLKKNIADCTNLHQHFSTICGIANCAKMWAMK